ncbi:MAG: hypothetical protein ACT4PI_11145 [Actinomycetota bacterium]
MAPDSELLIRVARAWGAFELDAEQAELIAQAFDTYQATFAEISTQALRDVEPPLLFAPVPLGS